MSTEHELPTIDVHAAAIEPPTTVLLDVREHAEWDAGHAPRAVHIPLGELPARVGELAGAGRIVCICRSGNRSGRATAWLRSQGHDARNMTGGMTAWAAAGLPVDDRAGRPGTVV
jgi:rhodanese-related sulfurtransferase